MIVSRIKSPPHENRVEVLYQGEPIKIRDIPATADLGPDARKYWYLVCKINKRDGFLEVVRRGYNLAGILSGDVNGDSCSSTSIPFDEKSKKDLLELIGGLLR